MTAQPQTAESRITDTRASEPVAESQAEPQPEPVAEEILIEEISIDGMCGVY